MLCTAPLKLDHQNGFLIANRQGVRPRRGMTVDLAH
jgi:hypothetical protein